ncbi:short-chain dehydrogenase [Bacillus sp. FJAT-27225]|uniref:oxidoreductase n=1 Tax=Bacillus sp. FJAT-27225 TaxID=1743144 RepID=UPI00080C343D|nr:oxidoreductase [Bacillus sp. FJAT-27225]OCA90608.1 short-chain dehydrogenase [Bacillus sp. FJAT-27225]
MSWTKNNIPDQTGKVAVITGGNSGIGFEAAKVLAEKGAEVILAIRNIEKGEAAIKKIKSAYPDASIGILKIDLSDLASVRQFALEFNSRYPKLDILINNAGIMIPPLSKTKNGFESQFGNNHLGHFALTGLLLDKLKATPGSRVITVSSLAAHKATIDFDNLDGSKGYRAFKFYGQSKLANMLFGRELNNRFKENGIDVKSIVCHPGISNTNLSSRNSGKPANKFVVFLSNYFLQTAEMGALPTLYAATESSLEGGEYIGPDGKKAHKGYPRIEGVINSLFQEETALKLWDMSENMTGVSYNFDSRS